MNKLDKNKESWLPVHQFGCGVRNISTYYTLLGKDLRHNAQILYLHWDSEAGRTACGAIGKVIVWLENMGGECGDAARRTATRAEAAILAQQQLYKNVANSAGIVSKIADRAAKVNTYLQNVTTYLTKAGAPDLTMEQKKAFMLGALSALLLQLAGELIAALGQFLLCWGVLLDVLELLEIVLSSGTATVQAPPPVIRS